MDRNVLRRGAAVLDAGWRLLHRLPRHATRRAVGISPRGTWLRAELRYPFFDICGIDLLRIAHGVVWAT